ncbi:MAG TPA: hypothetical protein DCL44_02090 [Elusimicrobia bacterium]|nr:hypothetical protein [Elusimicrobiota bacterium]
MSKKHRKRPISDKAINSVPALIPGSTDCVGVDGELSANTKLSWLSRKPGIFVLIFFLGYLAIGISAYKDYGISWDEPTHREIASVTTKYLASFLKPGFQFKEFAGTPPLAEYPTKQYGVVFDLPMYVADVLLGYDGSMREAYYMRHLCTFLLFYVSVFFFYLIVRDRFKSRALGLTGCSFLILSPRIFAESFYGKDIVFLSLFIIAIYFFIRYLDRRTAVNAVLFALATALVVDQRITGVFIPALAVFITGIDAIKTNRTSGHLYRSLAPLVVYLVSFIVFMILFWPYLWENPLRNFIDAFRYMNRFPITYDVLYLGKFIKSTEVPWHYIPVWILITTPVTYSFLFLAGFIRTIRGIIGSGFGLFSNDVERQDFLCLLLFFTPLAAVTYLNSALYDGWRHMYFIYVPFLLIAMTGLAWVLRLIEEAWPGHKLYAAFCLAAVILLSLSVTSYKMIRFHPFQNTYFNALAGNNAGEKYELDYWGLSFRQGLEYIVKNDKRPVIVLLANVIAPLKNNAVLLDKQDLDRLRLANINTAYSSLAAIPQTDYFLTNYRWHPQTYQPANEVYSISVDNQKIMSVFKLR